MGNRKSNITKPLGEYILCEKCGKRVKFTNNKVKYCDRCAKENWKEYNAQKQKEYRKNKKKCV